MKDANDNPPKFTQRNYVATISEKTNLKSIVMVVAATDLDEGSNSMINYSIVQTNETSNALKQYFNCLIFK